MTTAPGGPARRRVVSFIVPGALDTPTGGYAYDRQVARGLAARGWQVDVHVLEGGFPTPGKEALAAADALLGSLADDALVLCDGLAFGAMPDQARCHASRLRLVALVHHPLAAETGLPPDTAAALVDSERRALAATCGVVVTSRATAALLADYDVPADRITVAAPGTSRASASGGTRRADPRADVQLLCVATLVPRKGHGVLLDALARLRKHAWQLTCVGSLDLDRATAAGIRDTARAHHLEERVAFVGAVQGTELDAYYDRADVFVLPTFYEGYGMAVAEAVARGLPVVCSRTGALPDLVDADSGVLIPPGDVDALTVALAGIIGDDAQRARLAAGARARAAALPTWQDTVAAMESALLQASTRGELQR
jgi:glycosyltransferase involved in cell wall biosynthesis